MNAQDDEHDDHDTPITSASRQSTPSSPPPSFRSRASSPTSRRLISRDDPLHNEEGEDHTLADTFDDGEASDAEDGSDDRQRLMRADPEAVVRETEQQRQQHQPTPTITSDQRSPMPRRVTELPIFTPTATRPQQPRGGNDGVFANLAAKPERGDNIDEKPPVRSEFHIAPIVTHD